MFTRINLLLAASTVVVLAADQHYRVTVQIKTGDTVGGERIIDFGGGRMVDYSNVEEISLGMADDGNVIFYGRTDHGINGLFTPKRAIALEGAGSEGITIKRFMNYNGYAYSATFTRADCGGCLHTGVFYDGKLKLDFKGEAAIGDIVSDDEQNIYAMVHSAEPPLWAIYKNSERIVKLGDKVPGGEIENFGKRMLVSGKTVGIPIIYTDGKQDRRDGYLVEKHVIGSLRNTVGLTTEKTAIDRKVSEIVVGDKTLFTSGIGAEFSVASEHHFAMRERRDVAGESRIAEEAIYSENGLVISESGIEALGFKRTFGARSCCLIEGAPSVNRAGEIAFMIRTRLEQKRAILKASPVSIPEDRITNYEDASALTPKHDPPGTRYTPSRVLLTLQSGKAYKGRLAGADALSVYLELDGKSIEVPVSKIRSIQMEQEDQ